MVTIDNIKEDLQIPLSMLSMSFLDKSKYKGSYKGVRFLFEKVVEEIKNEEQKVEETKEKVIKLKVYTWEDKLNFENTDEKDMTIRDFEYSKKGIDDGLEFVIEMVNKL